MKKMIFLSMLCITLIVKESGILATDKPVYLTKNVEQEKASVQKQIALLDKTVVMLSKLVKKGEADYNVQMKLAAIIKVIGSKRAVLERLKRQEDKAPTL